MNNLHIDGRIEGLSFPKKSRFFSVYLFQDKTDISLRRQSPKNHRRLSARDLGVEEGLTERGYLDIV